MDEEPPAHVQAGMNRSRLEETAPRVVAGLPGDRTQDCAAPSEWRAPEARPPLDPLFPRAPTPQPFPSPAGPPSLRLPGGRGLYEVRFHGRGGQGTVYASVLLAHAAFLEGRGVQAFPFFGVERRGAPVVAHARIGEAPVRLACEVASPDAVVVMDPTLVAGLGPRMAAGLRPGGTILVNSSRPQGAVAADLGIAGTAVYDASAIARRRGLGSPSNPIVNTAMLGSLAGLTGLVSWASLERAIREHVPARVEDNVAAAREAFLAAGGGILEVPA